MNDNTKAADTGGEWHPAGNTGDVSEDMPLTIKAGDKEVGVYLVNGQYYALEDICPHAYALLSQGFVMEGEIECPLHAARFDISTGKCTAGPGGRDLKVYPLRLEDDRIFVKVD
jgi:nitrite reductase/ring-hydroxylating ferredoxin subunit